MIDTVSEHKTTRINDRHYTFEYKKTSARLLLIRNIV